MKPAARRTRSTALGLALMAFLAAGVPAFAGPGNAGAVYVATNDVHGNEVMVFARSADGTLATQPKLYPTGGLGTGGGLGNQGGVILSANRRLLFVVNAGSDDFSVFRVLPKKLRLIAVTPCGGQRPISLTQHHRTLYVLNAGGAVGGKDSIAGFRLDGSGQPSPIPGSIQPLSAGSTGPAQIGFAAKGTVLLVSEKATDSLTTFLLGASGVPGAPLPQASIGQTPFGFAVARRPRLSSAAGGDLVLVSEAFGGSPGASAVTSYQLGNDGLLTVVAPSVPTQETAACWVAVSKNNRFAYTTNTGDSTVSGFAIEADGSLTLLEPDGVTAVTGSGPIDMGFSANGRFLYTLNSGDGSLTVLRHATNAGGLHPLQTVAGLPAGANGLAAR